MSFHTMNSLIFHKIFHFKKSDNKIINGGTFYASFYMRNLFIQYENITFKMDSTCNWNMNSKQTRSSSKALWVTAESRDAMILL